MTQENKFINGQFINGEWEQGEGHELESVNPANNEVLWQAMSATPAQVDRAVMAAREAFLPWADLSVEESLAIVKRFGELLTEYKE